MENIFCAEALNGIIQVNPLAELQELFELKNKGAIPVSYTHLTQPTIRLV